MIASREVIREVFVTKPLYLQAIYYYANSQFLSKLKCSQNDCSFMMNPSLVWFYVFLTIIFMSFCKRCCVCLMLVKRNWVYFYAFCAVIIFLRMLNLYFITFLKNLQFSDKFDIIFM